MLRNRVLSAVEKSNGEVFSLIHPGFLMTNGNISRQIRAVETVTTAYLKYLEAVSAAVSIIRRPLLLFGEFEKPKQCFDWIISAASSDTVLFVETEAKSPLPLLKGETYDDIYRGLWKGLGIKRSVFAGELLFSEEDGRGAINYKGCVAGAYAGAAKHIDCQIDFELTFPNTSIPRTVEI